MPTRSSQGEGDDGGLQTRLIVELNDVRKIQRLERLVALCPACHEVKHAGLASTRGRLSAVIAHLAKVNGWSPEDAELYLKRCSRHGRPAAPPVDPRHLAAQHPLRDRRRRPTRARWRDEDRVAQPGSLSEVANLDRHFGLEP